MSPSSPIFQTTVFLLLSSVLGGMVWSWTWAIRQWRQGEALPPLRTSQPVPWGGRSVLLIVVTWVVVNLGVTSVYVGLIQGAGREVAAGHGVKEKPATADSTSGLSFTEQMVLVSVANVLLTVAVPLILRGTSGARLADLGIQREGLGRQVQQGLLAFFLITPVVYALNAVAVLLWTWTFGKTETHTLEKMVRNDFSFGVAELAILSAVLLAPAAEELIFRGVIQGWLARVFLRVRGPEPLAEGNDLGDVLDVAFPPPSADETAEGPPPSPRPRIAAGLLRGERWRVLPTLVASALFAIVHLPQWPAPLAIFFLSLGLGAVFEWTGSLISTFTMHAMFNAFGTLLLFQSLLLVEPAGEKGVAAPVGLINTQQFVSK
jgi:membrane protease YdiL (CAAX protease family)